MGIAVFGYRDDLTVDPHQIRLISWITLIGPHPQQSVDLPLNPAQKFCLARSQLFAAGFPGHGVGDQKIQSSASVAGCTARSLKMGAALPADAACSRSNSGKGRSVSGAICNHTSRE